MLWYDPYYSFHSHVVVDEEEEEGNDEIDEEGIKLLFFLSPSNYSVDSGEGEAGDETEIKDSVATGDMAEDEDALDLNPANIGAYWLQRELVCLIPNQFKSNHFHYLYQSYLQQSIINRFSV